MEKNAVQKIISSGTYTHFQNVCWTNLFLAIPKCVQKQGIAFRNLVDIANYWIF